MAWYYGEFSCGHEGRVNIVGPVKNRQWIADRKFEGLCPECWEKHVEEEKERKNAEAEEKAKEMELPELTGSEKQVAWANAIRQNLIEEFDKIEEISIERRKRMHGFETEFKDLPLILDYILKNKTEAKYFIDNRNKPVYGFILAEEAEALKPTEVIAKEEAEAKTMAELKAEATVYPENRITEAVVEIKTEEDKITAYFEKNEKFIEIVKSLGYGWSGVWSKELNERTGSYIDRGAELGNKLLNAGFPIRIMDRDIREKAISGDFEVECDRWIIAPKDYESYLKVIWSGKNDTLYKRSRSLPGGKWQSGGTMVRVEHYKEVEEFAGLYGFKLSTPAQKRIQEFINAKELSKVVEPAKVETAEAKDGLGEILKSSGDVLDDLKD